MSAGSKRTFARVLAAGSGIGRAFVLTCAGLAASPALAQSPMSEMEDCGIVVEREIVPPAFVYDPFDPVAPVDQKMLTLLADSDASALVTLETEAGLPLPVRVGESELMVTLNARNANGWSPTTPGSFVLDLEADEARSVAVDFLIDNTVIAPPGTYTERLFISVSNQDTGMICDERPAFDVVVDVPPRAQVNIAGTRGDFSRSLSLPEIDFGSLVEGNARTVFIQVRSNSDIEMRIRSENAGALVFDDNEEIDARVPYQAILDGNAIDLAGEYVSTLPAANTTAGESLPMDLIIGAVPGVPSGRYTDTITVEVSGL